MIPEIAFGVGAAFLWGFADFFTKKTVQAAGPVNTAFYSHLLSCMLTGILLLWLPPQQSLSFSLLSTAAFGGILWGLGNALFSKALESGAVSVVTPVNSSYSLFVLIPSLLFLGETLSPTQLFLVTFIIVGVVFTSFKLSEFKRMGNRSKPVQGAVFAFLSGASSGLGLYFLKPIAQAVGAVTGMFLLYFFSLFLMTVWYLSSKTQPLSLRGFRLLAWISVLYVAANLTYAFGVSRYLASLIAPISSAFPLVTIVLAYLFGKEKLELNQYVGIAIVVLGAAFLSI